MLGEVIEAYLTQTVETREELILGIDERDTHALERAAHKLRGMCANVGASALSSVCAELETLGRLAQLDRAAGIVERFDAEFARVRDALNLLATTS